MRVTVMRPLTYPWSIDPYNRDDNVLERLHKQMRLNFCVRSGLVIESLYRNSLLK